MKIIGCDVPGCIQTAPEDIAAAPDSGWMRVESYRIEEVTGHAAQHERYFGADRELCPEHSAAVAKIVWPDQLEARERAASEPPTLYRKDD